MISTSEEMLGQSSTVASRPHVHPRVQRASRCPDCAITHASGGSHSMKLKWSPSACAAKNPRLCASKCITRFASTPLVRMTVKQPGPEPIGPHLSMEECALLSLSLCRHFVVVSSFAACIEPCEFDSECFTRKPRSMV